jgi:hypothetical protein
MITKETFVKTMNRLERLNEKMNAVDSAMKDLDPDFCSFYILDIFNITLDVLQEAMHDEEDWISYFAFEYDWLQNFSVGDVTVDDKDIEIDDWADVYDFLIANMEED